MQAINLPPFATVPVSLADPAGQVQSAAALASVTFSAATGGTGSYSYGTSFTKPVGSAATLAGSGVGPYTWTTDVEGLYRVTLTATDGRGVSSVAVGDVILDLPDTPLAWDDPAIQSQTSAALASVTFGAPTGGIGGKTYAVVGFNKPVGSAATQSGSGLGPYTWTTDVEGAYSLELEATDAQGITTRATGIVNLDLADSPLVWSNPDPTVQSAAALASHTFDAPTGGAGGNSYSATLVKKPTGSSASLSGSGLGAYTFTSDVPGVYEVRNVVTDSRGITQASTWVVSLKPPQIAWTMPASQTKTSIGAESITFNAASGGTGTLTYSDAAFAEKPVGSAASLSGSGVGPYSFTTDNAGNYIVKVKVTDEQGVTEWMFGTLTLDLTGAATWEIVGTYDLTDCENIDVSATGTYNVKKADGVTALITVTKGHTTGTAAVLNADFVTGTGLVADQHSTLAGAQNAYLSFNLQELSLDFDNNVYYIEFLIASAALEAATSATLHFGVADATGVTADPMFGHGFNRPSAITWEDLSRKYGSSATQTSGAAGAGTSIPATYNVGVEVYGGQMAYVYRGTSASYEGPRVPTAYRGTLGANSNPVGDTHSGIWAGAFAFFVATTQTLLGSTTWTLKGIRVYVRPPHL